MKTRALTARCASAAVAALLAVSLTAGPALAAPEDVAAPAAPDAAAAEATSYTVRLYAGNRGLVNDGAFFEWDGVPYGTDLDMSGARVTVTDPKYYVKGIRLAGLDNVKDVSYVGQVDDRNFVAGSVRVTQDADYVLAYGIMANRVAYTVRYVDADGFGIAPSDVYYGDVGDTPAVTPVYVEGYVPNAYAISKTLVDDEEANVITFTYARVAAGYTTEPGDDGSTVVVTPEGERVPTRQPAAPAPAEGAGGADGEGTEAGADAEAPEAAPVALTTADGEEIIGDDGNPLMAPSERLNIDDDAVPLAAAGYGEGAESPEGGLVLAANPASVALIGAGLLLLVVAFVLWRRRKNAREA